MWILVVELEIYHKGMKSHRTHRFLFDFFSSQKTHRKNFTQKLLFRQKINNKSSIDGRVAAFVCLKCSLKETPGRRSGLNEKKRVKKKKETILIDGRMQPRVPSNLSSNFVNEKVLWSFRWHSAAGSCEVAANDWFPLAQQKFLVNNELQIFCAGFSAMQRLAKNIILILNNFNETEKCEQKVFNGKKSCCTIIACHRGAKCYNFSYLSTQKKYALLSHYLSLHNSIQISMSRKES